MIGGRGSLVDTGRRFHSMDHSSIPMTAVDVSVDYHSLSCDVNLLLLQTDIDGSLQARHAGFQTDV